MEWGDSHCRTWATIFPPLLSFQNSTKGNPESPQTMSHKTPTVSLWRLGKEGARHISRLQAFNITQREKEASIHQAHLCFQLHVTTPGSGLHLLLLTSPDTIYCGFIKSAISWLTLLLVKNYSPTPPTSCPLWMKLVLTLQENFLGSKTSCALSWEVTIHCLETPLCLLL